MIAQLVEETKSDGANDEIAKVADETTKDISDDISNVGGAAAVEEGLDDFDAEAEEKSAEDGWEKDGWIGESVCMFGTIWFGF